jgi:guanylate kinase
LELISLQNNRNLFVLSGPSGSGKNTVYEGVKKLIPEIEQTVSATTRTARDGEICAVDYYYIKTDDFIRRVKDGDFVEYVNYGDNYYGTLKSEIHRLTAMNKIIVMIIEVNGALNIKKVYPDAVTIFITPPSLDELRRRISGRGQNSDDEIEKRLQIAASEMEQSKFYDYCVINDQLDQCINEVYKIIKGEN